MTKEIGVDGKAGFPTFRGLVEEKKQLGKETEEEQPVRQEGNKESVMSWMRKWSTVVQTAGRPSKMRMET